MPVLVALGHATDDLVVARVADASFPTPTALGAWLRQTVEAERAQSRQAEEARVLTESRASLAPLDRLEAAQAAATWWRAVAVVLVAVLLAVGLWVLLGR